MDIATIPKQRQTIFKPKPYSVEASKNKRRKTVASQASSPEEFHMAYTHLRSSDEYENIAITWANDLKKMNPEQQIHAKKAISDILYEGQLGTLHRHSVTINANNAPFGTSQFQQVNSLEATYPSTSSASTSMPAQQS